MFADEGHYDYSGSLTTPPCTEGVQWVVQATPVSVKQSQIDAFWNYLGGYPGNARNIQSLNGRTITFNVDNTQPRASSSENGNAWFAVAIVFIILFVLLALFTLKYVNDQRRKVQPTQSTEVQYLSGKYPQKSAVSLVEMNT